MAAFDIVSIESGAGKMLNEFVDSKAKRGSDSAAADVFLTQFYVSRSTGKRRLERAGIGSIFTTIAIRGCRSIHPEIPPFMT